uniref:Phosphatidic acid phosphatase type 2/haloperoxidase domain-containing protein n=1 Tax=viral metagenome TaxID=1070528 RepID=A0A6C0JQL9_9ZZZZ
MELNILSLSYLFLRLAPFVLVCFFSLSSIFNQDFKGLVYLVGLLVACFLTIFLGNVMPFIPGIENRNMAICNPITIGNTEISTLPLGQAVFGYTFAYLLYTIIKYDYVKKNIPTLVFFPLIIVFDMLWNIKNSCYSIGQLGASLVIAGLFGWLWSYIIDKTNNKYLQYFVGINNKEVCSKPSASTFKCAVYKNGQLISSNMATPEKSK